MTKSGTSDLLFTLSKTVGKRLSSLGIEAPKKYTSSAFRKDKDNYHLFLLLSCKTPLATSTLFASREVSNDLTPSVFTMSFELNFVKLGLTNVNDILTFTSIQCSLYLNQIIFHGKIWNRIGKFLEV